MPQPDDEAAAPPPPPPGVAALPPAPPAGVHVLHGTCGWSDASLVRCGRFYPASIRSSSSSEDKLRHYSRHFGCVEVDTSTYAIPRPDVTKRWAQAAADGFQFHVKAFGLFCSQGSQVGALPAEARARLPPSQQQQQQHFLRLSAMPAEVEDTCWRLFHAALEPLYQAGKLGAVVFQFHLTFLPSQQNLEYILRCRARLDPRFSMAVECRCRRWFTEPAWRRQLCEALSAQGICLVSADELEHETVQKDREQTGLPPGAVRRLLPVALEVTTPAWHYVRVHRRHGTTARLLQPDEIEAWAGRIARQLAPRLRGPISFLWGTDWEDVPIQNARNLDQALPPNLRLDWRQQCRKAAPRPGTLQSFFAAKPLASHATTGAAAAPAGEAAQGEAAGPPTAASDDEASEHHSRGVDSGSRSASAGRQKRGREGAAEAGSREPGGRRRASSGGILRFLQPKPAAP